MRARAGNVTGERTRRGAFKSVAELETAIQEYLGHRNADSKPFVCAATATPDGSTKVVLRGRTGIKAESTPRTLVRPPPGHWCNRGQTWFKGGFKKSELHTPGSQL